MPLDVTPRLFEIDESLNYGIRYEPSRLNGYKFGINTMTDKACSHVSNTF